MPVVVLKVDVDTLRGTQEGVPALLRLFDRHAVRGTFLFSLGPDHTGRALKRVFRPGFLAKVSRTSVTSHYGIKTLLYGTLLPGPDIGRRAADAMRAAADAGHETGVHTWDHVLWQDAVARKDAAWTERQMLLAVERYVEVFKQPPAVHGAAGWQMNDAALALLGKLGYRIASDTRGTAPFVPIAQGRECIPQYPTTLPTLDELIGREGVTPGNVHEVLLKRSSDGRDHVFTLHAELEGGRLAPVMERLLDGWRRAGMAVRTLGEFASLLDTTRLPRAPVLRGTVDGRSGDLALQGLSI